MHANNNKPITARFLNQDKISLFESWWLPPKTPKAVLVVVHGYGEHIGRYGYAAEYWTGRGYAVGGFDMRGHGQSAEQRTFIESYQAIVNDIIGFFGRVEDRFPHQKRFILGHSMGGAIVTMLLTQQPNSVDGAIVSGAGIKITTISNSPLLIFGAGLLSRLVPRLPTLKPNLTELTHDPDLDKKVKTDPLGLIDKRVSARTGHELLRYGPYFDAHLPTITTPLLILHGSADSIAAADGSRQLYANACSTDKTLHIYEGMFHELHNETIRDDWMIRIGDWMDARL